MNDLSDNLSDNIRISREEAARLADKMMLDLTDDELAMVEAYLHDILAYISRIDAIDTDGVEPCTNFLDPEAASRADDPSEPHTSRGFFAVPPIVSAAHRQNDVQLADPTPTPTAAASALSAAAAADAAAQAASSHAPAPSPTADSAAPSPTALFDPAPSPTATEAAPAPYGCGTLKNHRAERSIFQTAAQRTASLDLPPAALGCSPPPAPAPREEAAE